MSIKLENAMNPEIQELIDNLDNLEATYAATNAQPTPQEKIMPATSITSSGLTQMSTTDTKKAKITDLPFDIVQNVFKMSGRSGISNLTSLGITCVKFYAFLKILHPQPIPLASKYYIFNPEDPNNPEEGYLGRLLEDWFPSTYRLSLMRKSHSCYNWGFNLRFLLKSEYGILPPDESKCCLTDESGTPQEVALMKRYWDHHDVRFYEQKWDERNIWVNDYERPLEAILPSPHGIWPEEWEERSLDILKRFIVKYLNEHENSRKLHVMVKNSCLYWRHYKEFDQIIDGGYAC